MITPALLTRPGYADLIRNTPGLVAYWRMRDLSSTTVARNELSTAGATLTGAPLPYQGAPVPDGAAIKFNGTSQALQAAIDLSAYAKVSLSFWLYWDAFANTDNLAFEFTANGGSTNGGFFIDPNSGSPASGKFQILFRANSQNWWDAFTRPTAAAWHHYLVTLDVATPLITFYIDGLLQTATSTSHGTPTGVFANSTLNFMSRNKASLWSAGRLSEVALYSGVLTANDARNHYQAGLN